MYPWSITCHENLPAAYLSPEQVALACPLRARYTWLCERVIVVFYLFFILPCRVPKSVGKLLYLCHAKLLDLLVLWVDLLSVCSFVDRHPFFNLCIVVRKHRFTDFCKSFRCCHFSFCSFKRPYNKYYGCFHCSSIKCWEVFRFLVSDHGFQNLIFAQRLEFYHQQ